MKSVFPVLVPQTHTRLVVTQIILNKCSHDAGSSCYIFLGHPAWTSCYIFLKNIAGCPRAKGACWFGLLLRMTSLLTSFEIAAPSFLAKTNGLAWMHGTMVSTHLEGIHFTDSSCHDEMVFGG